MAKLPSLSLSDKLNLMIDSKSISQGHRGYLGMSEAGHNCDRYLWMVLHNIYNGTHDRRVQRIFDRGHWEEPRVIKDLLGLGAEVSSEQEEVTLLDGKVLGHSDGVVSDVPGTDGSEMLLEVKAINSTTFSKYLKQGIKDSNDKYYVQMQLYMHCLGLTNALFVATNKDNEKRYWEIVPYDAKYTQTILKRLERIVSASKIPAKIGCSDWYECKFCSMYDHCHAGAPTNISCRSCANMVGNRCQLGIKADIDKGCEDAWEDITRGV